MKVTINDRQIIGAADKMLYGHFLEHFHRQVYGGVFDPSSEFADADGFRTDVIEAMKRIKVPIIRWPGGCYVSAYDWKKGVGKDRIPTYDKAWRVEEPHLFGTDEFMKLCGKLGCEPYICTNAGTGSAEDMSDWVEYCNLESMGQWAKARIKNGFEKPHNVKYWSIGNENWGGHEIGAKDSVEWGKLVRESAKMMLRVDPTLELSAASIVDLDWNLNLLRIAGQYLDWISIHGYWTQNEDYLSCMAHTDADISGSIDRVRAYLTALGLEKRIKIAYDEWNLRGWYHPNFIDTWNRDKYRGEDRAFYERKVLGERDKNDINSTYTMADAVFSACFLNTCLRNCDIVKMACFSPIVNTRGAIFTHDKGIVLRPQYFVFDLYANYMKGEALNAWIDGAPSLRIGEKEVTAADVAVMRDGNGYAIAAVNKDPVNAVTIDLGFIDGAPRTVAVRTVNGESENSYNDIGKTEVGIKVSPEAPFTGKVTLEPHSVNVIELK